MNWSLELKKDKSSNAATVVHAWPKIATFSEEPVVENSTYWWNLKGNWDSPFEITLKVNGSELSRDIVSHDNIWFRWDIGFNAGFADVEVRGLSVGPHSERIIVDPSRNKLVRKDFRLMLGDIIADTRSLASTCGLHEGLAKGDEHLPIATLEFILESSIPIQRLVKELDSLHQKRLIRATSYVPLGRAHRVTSTQWNTGNRRRGAVAQSAVLRKLPPRVQRLVVENGGKIPTHVLQSKPLIDSRRREHSEILGFIHRLIADLRNAARHLNSPKIRDEELILQQRCLKTVRQLSTLLSLPVFNSVLPKHSRWAHSHLYQQVDPYRGLYRLYRDVRSGISGIDGDFTRIPLRETFRLYETWVSLRLAHAANILDPALNASSMFIDVPDRNRLTFVLGTTSIEFHGHRLKFKPVFNEVWLTSDGVGSYSRRMVPDIVLEILDEKSSHKNVIVLDAKYRVDAQINDAISSIHMYKDSLIHEDRTENNLEDIHIVGAGLVVVPNLPSAVDTSKDWRSEKMPSVIFREGYRQRFKLGALVLNPGMDLGSIAGTLQKLIQENRFPSSDF